MNNPISFLSSVLALIGFWIALDAGYRPYRVCLLRERLFELRSELFDAAQAGRFGAHGFSDAAYCYARCVLEGSIRIADQMTLTRLFVLLFSSRWWLDRAQVQEHKAVFDRALMAHDERTRNIVNRILRETDIAIVLHMLHVNVVGLAVLTAVKIGAGCFRAQRKVCTVIAQKIVRNRRMFEALEREALQGLERPEYGRPA